MLDRTLRCSCNRFAYADAFLGEYGELGYTCSSCLRALNEETVRKWEEDNRGCSVEISSANAERGYKDLMK